MPKLAGENSSLYFIPRGFGLKGIGDSGFFDRYTAIPFSTAFKSVTFEKFLDATPSSKSCSMIDTWPFAALFPILRTCLFART